MEDTLLESVRSGGAERASADEWSLRVVRVPRVRGARAEPRAT